MLALLRLGGFQGFDFGGRKRWTDRGCVWVAARWWIDWAWRGGRVIADTRCLGKEEVDFVHPTREFGEDRLSGLDV